MTTANSNNGAEEPLSVEPIVSPGMPLRPDARNLMAEARHAIRRRWLATTVAGLFLGSLTAAGVWLIVPRQYNATAVLRVSMEQSNIFEVRKTGEAANSFDLYKRTQRQLLRSPLVLSAALQQETVARLPLIAQQADPIEWLQNIVTIAFPDDAEIMYVSVRCEDQQTAEALTNAIVKVYLDDIVYAERQEKLNTITNMQKAETETELLLRKKRSELRGLADALGTGDSEALTLAQKNTFEQYSALWKELNQVEFELKRARGRRKTARGTAPAEPEPVVTVSNAEVESAAMLDPRIITTQAQLERLQTQIRDAPKTMYGDVLQRYIAGKQPDVEQERKKIADHKQALKDDLLFKKRSAALAAEQSHNLSVDMLEALQKDLAKQVADLRKEAEKFGRSSVDVELMRTEIKGLDDLRDHLERNLHTANIEIANLKSRVVLLSPASTRQSDDRSRRLRLSAGLGVFGLFLGCASIIFWDMRWRRLNTLQELAEALRLPLLGTVPHVPRSKRRNLSESGVLEAIDGIIAKLVLSPSDDSRQVILVTSASAGEGKTSVSANVAMAMAAMGRRTVLIDFDLRRPTLHEMFQVDLTPGVGGILTGEVEPLDAVVASSVENLFILPAGACGQRGLSAGNDEQVKGILSKLREAFVHVVIDAGPVLPIVDTRIVARHVDGVVISLLRDVSQIPKVDTACELLRSFDVRILGAVMVGAPGEVYYSRSIAEATKA
jgi:polysaccharide biosynthesis transport protein